MTCMTMIDRMLEADLDELEAQGESDIALHVRHCERCRAVAAQIVRDTRELAQMAPGANVPPVRTMPQRSAARRRHLAAIVGVAAALAFVVVRSSNQHSAVDRATSVVMQPVTVAPLARIVPDGPASLRTFIAATGTARGGRPTGRITHPARRPDIPAAFTMPAAVQVERIVVAPAERAVAVMPVRLSPAPEPPLGDTVSVDPPAGKRAQIIRTTHPGVTVVWLYE